MILYLCGSSAQHDCSEHVYYAECAGWVQLALFLLKAQESGDPDWGGYLEEAQQKEPRPVLLWSEELLQELQGTQVSETVMQYRCASTL
jgi:hypothetical protein